MRGLELARLSARQVVRLSRPLALVMVPTLVFTWVSFEALWSQPWTRSGDSSIPSLPYLVGINAALSLFDGLAARIVLAGGWVSPRLDLGLAKYVGAHLVFQLAEAILWMAAAPSPEEGVTLLTVLAWALVPVFIWIQLRLMLWPLSRLFGGPPLSPAASWRMMAGHARAVAAAAILLGGIPTAIYLASWFGLYELGPLPWLLGTAPAATLSALIGVTIAAETYRTRIGP